jgi:hypothetical protein
LAIVAGAFFAIASCEAIAGQQVGVGQDPAPPMGPFFGTDMIMIGTPSEPASITLDPTTTTPWMKTFVLNRDGLGWATDGPLSMALVMESIAFPPSTIPGGTTSPRPSDWHEDIDPTVGDGGSFKWAGGSILIGTATYPGMTSTDGKSIWFSFPPIPPSAPPVKITKQLMWTGGVITPGPNGSNNYTIKINERPSVPEPSTLALVGAGLLGAGRLRQGRRIVRTGQ